MKNSEVFSNIRVAYENSATINTGNFQNVKPLYRIEADVAEGVSPTEAIKRLEDLVEAWLDARVAKYHEELNG